MTSPVHDDMTGSDIRFDSGPAASHTFITIDNKTTQITFDWTYDSVYFKFPEEGWVTLELTDPDYSILDSPDKKSIFQTMIADVNTRLRSYPYNGVPEALVKLNDISTYYRQH